MDTIEKLTLAIDKFAEDRNWSQFHTPANLAKSISIEANELLECFQWNEESYSLDEVKEELADVFNYSLRMASILNLDVSEIVLSKIKKNEEKYPVKKSFGKADKYTKL